MRRTAILITIIILLLGAGLVYVLAKNSAAPKQSAADSTQESTQEQTTESRNDASAGSAGAYLAYTAKSFEQAEGKRVLFFHAGWCPQCRALDADIREHGVPDGYTILKVDYDSNQNLREQYGVTIQTTLVAVDSDGNKVGSYVAYDEPSVAAVTRDFLK